MATYIKKDITNERTNGWKNERSKEPTQDIHNERKKSITKERTHGRAHAHIKATTNELHT